MSTTTQILFNSPALHSLKRDQLVKLCKIHRLKANGKNSELIERLKQRAQELPEEESEDEEGAEGTTDVSDIETGSFGGLKEAARPSEQWEVVMEDIQEAEEMGSSMGTLSSMKSFRSGEFGTSSSKSSVGSSLKALASSLGIKRSLSAKPVASPQNLESSSPMPPFRRQEPEMDELDKHSVPYSSIPPAKSLPQTDHFKFSTPDISLLEDNMNAPVPGSPTRPGLPAPANARLDSGLGSVTTIRLVSTPYSANVPSPPRLTPYPTDFDIIMDSPGSGKGNRVWPVSPPPPPKERLYPALPLEDMVSIGKYSPVASSTPAKVPSVIVTKASETPAIPRMPNDGPTKDIFSPLRVPGSTTRGSIPRSQPFLFGSPLPQHRLSNHDFGKAAANVLEEMNKRLENAGVQRMEKTVLESKSGEGDIFGPANETAPSRRDSGDRFAKAHKEAFNKMDSIATHYAARRGSAQSQTGSKRKSEALGHGCVPSAKRKSSVASHTGMRAISNGVRRNMGIPGGFGGDDAEEDERDQDPGDRRSSKRIRVAEGEDVSKGRRVTILPPISAEAEAEKEKEDKRKEKERETMKRKLNAQKARRRSSRARASVSGKTPGKSKTSRFGFLSSAKTLVRNVWNFGAGTNKAAPTPVPAPAPPPPPPKLVPETKAPATTQMSRKPSIGLGNPSTKPSARPRIPSDISTNGGLKPDARLANVESTSSRSRSPIPVFSPPTRSTTSRTPSLSGAGPRIGSTPIGAQSSSSRLAPRSGSIASPSMGARSSLVSGHSAAVSSLGQRKSSITNSTPNSATTRRPETISEIQPTPRRPSSSLLAPTASSLAKTHDRPLVIPKKSIGTHALTLQQITNGPQSPRPTKIFTQPLAGFGSPNAIPPGARVPSLTTAATKLMGPSQAPPPTPALASRIPVPPKPKTLVARKPRISRSRVIAKLGAQRAASGTSTTPSATPSRVRSSMTNGTRRSFAGVKGNRASASRESLVMSAKKQVRKSEHARRKSRAAESRGSSGQGRDVMDVDD